jgi:hypothetical protein
VEGLIEGRIVHFVLSPDVHRPAIVVNVQDKEKGICDLFVFLAPKDERGAFLTYTGAWYTEKKLSSTWHWIEKA